MEHYQKKKLNFQQILHTDRAQQISANIGNKSIQNKGSQCTSLAEEEKHRLSNHYSGNQNHSAELCSLRNKEGAYDKLEEIETDVEFNKSVKSIDSLRDPKSRHDYASVNEGEGLNSKIIQIIENDLFSLSNLAAALGKSDVQAFCKEVSAPLFSDLVIYLQNQEFKEHRLLFIKGSMLYFLTPDGTHKLIGIPLSKIIKILLLSQSPQAMVISLHKFHSYLLQTSNRLELALFVHTHQKRLHIPAAQIIFSKNKNISSHSRSLSLHNIQSHQGYISSSLLKFWKYKSIKAGLLWLLETSKLSHKEWTEKIVILTKVGLMIYDSLESEPQNFIPIVNSQLVLLKSSEAYPELNLTSHLNFNEINQFFPLEIISPKHSSLTLLFHGESVREHWVELIKHMQRVYNQEELKLVGEPSS